MTNRAGVLILNSIEGDEALNFFDINGNENPVMGDINPMEYPKDAAIRIAQEMLMLDVSGAISDEGFPVGDAMVFFVDGSSVDLANMAPNDELANWSWEQRPENFKMVEFFGFPRAKPGNKERLHSKDSLSIALGNAETELSEAIKGVNIEKIDVAWKKLNDAHKDVVDFLAQSDVEGLPKDIEPGDVGAKENGVDIKPALDIDQTTMPLRNESKTNDETARIAFINGDKILVSRQKSGDFLLPGGHLKENETPDQAALREGLEETGLGKEDILAMLSGESYEETNPKMTVFLANADGLNISDLTPKDDVEGFEWVEMPFTDSMGFVHPPNKNTDAEEKKDENENEKGESKNQERKNYITHDDGKWTVHAESGKEMGTYDSEDAAKKRLSEIELFKHENDDNSEEPETINCQVCGHDWDLHNGEGLPCGADGCLCECLVAIA